LDWTPCLNLTSPRWLFLDVRVAVGVDGAVVGLRQLHVVGVVLPQVVAAVGVGGDAGHVEQRWGTLLLLHAGGLVVAGDEGHVADQELAVAAGVLLAATVGPGKVVVESELMVHSAFFVCVLHEAVH